MNSQQHQNVHTLLQEYEISFESIFDRKDFREVFHDYLKSQVMAESFLFYVAVEQYQLLKATGSRYQAAKEITNNFLLPSSPHQVNISGSDKSEILDEFKNSNEEECSTKLFDKAQGTIFLELKCEKFPMFVKSPTLEHFLEQKGALAEEYLSQVGKKRSRPSQAQNLLSPSSAEATKLQQKSTELMDIEHHDANADVDPTTCFSKISAGTFSIEDFKLIMALVKHKEIWKDATAKRKSDGYTLQVSHKPFAYARRNIKLFKETAVLPYSADELLWALTDTSMLKQLEPNAISKHLHYVPRTKQDDFSYSINEQIFQFPFPFSKRQFIISTSAYKTTSGHYVLAKKSVDYPNIKATGVRGNYFGGVLIEKLSDITCRYTIVARMDMKGNFSESQMNNMISSRNANSVNKVTGVLLFRRNLKLKKPQDSHKVLDTIEANTQTIDSSLISV